MCCSDPPPPPDLTPLAEGQVEIAKIQAATAGDQMEWAKEQDAMNRETLQTVLDITLPIAQQQSDIAGVNAENAAKDRARYEEIFQPLEDSLIQEFQEYDSPERQAAEAGKAIADVTSTFDASRRNALQRLESYGVDPSQTRNAALDVGVRTSQAAAQAAAATASRQRVQDVGRSLRAEAINIGRGMPSQVAQGYQTALGAGQGAVNAGSSAVQNSTGVTASGVNAYGGANAAYGGAQSGYGAAANTYSQGYGNQMQGWQAGQDQTMGWVNAASGVAGMMVADGGSIPQAIPYMQDGKVATGTGDGSGIDDAVPAQLSDGEYVIPADVVRIKGEEFFDKLLEKYHTPAAEQEQQPGPAVVQAPPQAAPQAAPQAPPQGAI